MIPTTGMRLLMARIGLTMECKIEHLWIAHDMKEEQEVGGEKDQNSLGWDM